MIFFACSPETKPTLSENYQAESTEYNVPLDIPEISKNTLETLSEPTESTFETTYVTDTPVDTPPITEPYTESPVDTTQPPETMYETSVETTPETEIIPETLPETSNNTEQPIQTEADIQEVPTSPPEYAGTIALTFDDGPGKYTTRLLDILKNYSAKATFFVVGSRASYQKDILKRMTDEGHEVGNHTYSHISLKELEEQEIADQITSTKNIIFEATGIESNLVRAPYGDLSSTIKSVGGDQNVAFIHWSLDSFDWKTRDAQAVYDEIISRITDGDIILLHDIHESTVDAMEMVIPELINNGYKLVTVSELLLETRESIVPGAAYVRK